MQGVHSGQNRDMLDHRLRVGAPPHQYWKWQRRNIITCEFVHAEFAKTINGKLMPREASHAIFGPETLGHRSMWVEHYGAP